MHEVIMPKLGLTMESGKIEKWHKKEGDKVETGDVLFEVMTDKVSLEVESYNAGILRKILKGEGDEVPVTEVVAYIGTGDEEIPESNGQAPDVETKTEEVPVRAESGSDAAAQATGGRVKISPLAKKIAGENNIDILEVTGTGPRGRIVKEDIEKHIASAGSVEGQRIKISPLARKTAKELGIDWKAVKIEGSGPGGRIAKEDIIAYSKKGDTASGAGVIPGELRIRSKTELAGMRKVIAERMSLSKSTIPHIVLNAKADTTNLIGLREQLKEGILKEHGVKITFTDLILRAAAIALRENIEVNSSLQGNDYIIYDDINVGMAIAVEGGLIVPTIFSCDRLGIIDIAKKRIELIEKARTNKFALEEIQGGTFTVTNLGMLGIRNFSAIINPPQAAILAVGEIYSEPAAVDGKIEIRSFMDISVSCDHRIIDGAKGARFLQNIVELFESPAMLVI
ncbi:MAG: 2-oxo acid dehydrogenase subunit E2 [Actinomycetia bacterium]|nr:2-oxo acid dehydrogenase subunit E2 [Actinomycetes bacterium]